MRYDRCAAAILVVAMMLARVAPRASAEDAKYSESEVKAAFILNFAKLSNWPSKAFADGGAPFTIGILGGDPFGGALEKTCQGQSVAGRKVSIKRTSLEDAKSCQLVFVSKSERGRLGEILPNLQGAIILTVGEGEQFTRQGGAIAFVMDGDRVRFEINPNAAQRAGVKVSSQLLKLGRIVGS